MNQVPVPRSAAPAPVAAGDHGTCQYLAFTLNGEVFAIGILNVKEIIEYGNLTRIPMTPAFIRGVINLRGAVLPVVDLSARFGERPTATARRTCIVIVEIVQRLDDGELRQDIGIVVDSVNEVLEIAPADIEPAPAFGARIRADFIQGMGKVGDRFVILLDVGRVLSVDELGELAAVSSAAAERSDGVETVEH